MKILKKVAILIALTLLVVNISSCNKSKTNKTDTSTGEAKVDSIDTENLEFTDNEKDIDYDESECTIINLDDAESIVEITEGGSYIISGTLENGQIQINAEDEKVKILLNGANVTNSTGAALYVVSADKVFLTIAENSENSFVNSGEFVQIDDNNINAAIYAKDDIAFNGTGKLVVKSSDGHGISAKDDLTFYNGTYEISAENHAIDANDSIKIGGTATLTLTSGKDAIHCENTEETEKGYIYIESGTLKIESSGDGIDASGAVQINDGTLEITSGTYTASKSSSDGFNPWGKSSSSSSTSNSTSTKAVKADGDISVNGGTFTIVSEDDAFHANNNLYINGGTYTITTGDDALHAEVDSIVSGGTIEIVTCYEGVEGENVTINGGYLNIYATDDGLNAASGSSSSGGFSGFGGGSSSLTNTITINGGKTIINSLGDGLDSNANFYVTGGELYVSGATSSSNAALDFDGTGTITGGIVIATGMTGMAQNFGSDSTQGSIMISTSTMEADTEITLKDSSGNVLASWTSPKTFNSVVVSSPDIETGETYTLCVGSDSQSITMSSLIYGSSGGMGGGMGGGFSGGKGGMERK